MSDNLGTDLHQLHLRSTIAIERVGVLVFLGVFLGAFPNRSVSGLLIIRPGAVLGLMVIVLIVIVM